MSMTVTTKRERTIKAAWKRRGSKQWDPEVHGAGLISLNIPRLAPTNMRPQSLARGVLLPLDNLEFCLMRSTSKGYMINTIECESIVVETWTSPHKG
jgi:hypothetical protein